MNPKHPEAEEFIELKSLTPRNRDSQIPKRSLQGYKIISINGGGRAGQKPYIEMVINLWNTHLEAGKDLFVVGGDGIEDADIYFKSDYVKSYGKFKKKQKTLLDMMSNANEQIYGVALLYNEGNSIPTLDLSSRNTRLQINDQNSQLISEKIVDLIVYGSKAPTDRCNIFEDLVPSFKNKPYVLREFDPKKDLSLNRCTRETEAFIPNIFKLGKITPKEENDCAGVKFLLEDNIARVSQRQQENQDVDNEPRGEPEKNPQGGSDTTMELDDTREENVCAPRYASISSYQTVNTNEIEDYLEEEMDGAEGNICNNVVNLGARNLGETMTKNNVALTRIPTENREELKWWDSTSWFKDKWLDTIGRYQRDLLPVSSISSKSDVRQWFEYLHNENEPRKSTFRCRICYKKYDDFKLDPRYKPQVAKEGGYLR